MIPPLNRDPGAFGGLGSDVDVDAARFVVLPLPYDGTSTWLKGADRGPEAALEASANVELYDIITASEPWRAGIVTLAAPELPESPEAMTDVVHECAAEVLAAGKTLVSLGGEHSVTVGLVRAHAEAYPGLSVLQLDAHGDTRQSYEGSPYNHACVMARVAEICPYVQVGIRSLDASEVPGLDPARTFFAHQYEGTPAQIDAVVDALDDPVYITVDLDVLDPSEMPSTGTPEPGGLRYNQVVQLLDRVCARRRVVGFDVVELLPSVHDRAPDFLAARLVYQLMAFVKRGPERSHS